MNQLEIVGVDTASTRLHAVWTSAGVTDYPYKLNFSTSDSNPDVRRIKIHQQAHGFFGMLPDGTHVFCEEPLALQNGKTTRLLGLAAGAVWAAHLEFDLFWHWVDVATWKKDTVGRGNADKDDVRKWCVEQGFISDVEDLNDAYGINRSGAKALAKAGIREPTE